MIPIKKLLFLLFPLCLLSNCATTKVYSRVTVFHNLGDDDFQDNVKYSFLPPKSPVNNLEYSTYQDLIREELDEYSFQEVSSKDALFLISFHYAIGKGSERIGSTPVFGQTGVSSAATRGSFNYSGNSGTYQQSTSYIPSYGVVGSRAFSYASYPRFLTFKIMTKKIGEGKKSNVVYEAKVYSEGASNELASVMPAMVRSLFKEFPGESGTSKIVSFPTR